jgi:hypothetical protein
VDRFFTKGLYDLEIHMGLDWIAEDAIGRDLAAARRAAEDCLLKWLERMKNANQEPCRDELDRLKACCSVTDDSETAHLNDFRCRMNAVRLCDLPDRPDFVVATLCKHRTPWKEDASYLEQLGWGVQFRAKLLAHNVVGPSLIANTGFYFDEIGPQAAAELAASLANVSNVIRALPPKVLFGWARGRRKRWLKMREETVEILGGAVLWLSFLSKQECYIVGGFVTFAGQ